MRTVEEIKADIASCDSSWIDSALCRSLRCELYETILDGIPLDRLEAICAAEKDGRLVTLPNCNKCVYQQHGNISLACSNCIGGQSFDNDLFVPRAEAEKTLGKEQG